MPAPQNVRRWIMTLSISAITFTGAIYGAGLKTKQELHGEKKRTIEATPEEMIAQLEIARNELVGKKKELERKIKNFHERRKANDNEQNIKGQDT